MKEEVNKIRKHTFIKRAVATILAMCMMVGMGTTVFADEGDGAVTRALNSITPEQGYKIVSKEAVKFTDDIILLMTVEESLIPQMRGFTSTRTAKVTHTFQYGSSLLTVGKVSAEATFSSVANENVCYIDSHDYSMDDYGGRYITFNTAETQTWNNEGLGILNKYAKFQLEYNAKPEQTVTSASRNKMWVKCESDGKTFTSGNKTGTSTDK